MVQKHIGFSKDYNLFELTDAIAAMNVQKAGFIAYHFGKNNKSHPIVVTIGHLYGFFTTFALIFGYFEIFDPFVDLFNNIFDTVPSVQLLI